MTNQSNTKSNESDPILCAYLVDVKDYEMMQSCIHILEGIARGEAAIQENRVYSKSEAKNKMSKWLK